MSTFQRKPITNYVNLKFIYQMQPPKFIYDMLKRIEKRNNIQVRKNNMGQDYIVFGITAGENEMIERFKRGELDPKYYSSKNEEYNRELDRIINESLVNVKRKKYPSKIKGDYPDGKWDKYEYDQNGEVIYWERSSGFWGKWEYDENGNKTYYEDSRGYWVKWGYDQNNKLTYEEDSEGGIIDRRNQVNEGLVNVVRKQKKLTTIPKSRNDDVIQHFFDTKIHSQIRSWGLDNLKIVAYENGHGLMNYKTLLAWRTNNGEFYINTNKYSSTTSKIQSYIRNCANDEEKNRIVHYVSENELYEVAGVRNETGYYPHRDRFNEGLTNIEKKKNKIKYFGDFPDGWWIKAEYDDKNRIIRKEDPNGRWMKYIYDDGKKPIRMEMESGWWWKKEYDDQGNEIYYENSDGVIKDGRNKVNESLVNVIRKQKAEPIELSSNLLPIIDVNMYNSNLSPENQLSEVDNISVEGNNIYWEYFNNELYEKKIQELAEMYLTEIVLPVLIDLGLGIVNINVGEIVSPSSYNYGGDVLNYDIIVVSSFTNILINDIKQQDINELNGFLGEEFSSYAGFHSYMPTNIQELLKALNDPREYERGVAAYLTYKLRDQIGEIKEEFYEYATEEYLDEFDFTPTMPEDIQEKLHNEMNGEDVSWEEAEELNESLVNVKKIETPEKWLEQTFKKLTPIPDEEYPRYINYFYGDENYISYDTIDEIVEVDFNLVWNVLEEKWPAEEWGSSDDYPYDVICNVARDVLGIEAVYANWAEL